MLGTAGVASVLVEACVDTVASAVAAAAGGAGRVELCAELLEGGTTPSAGTIALTRERIDVPLFVLVRPRAGDFLYDAEEVEVMRRDIAFARAVGADGVVVGALAADGTVDAEVTRALIDAARDAARPLAVTFHRAFDVVRDQEEALDALLALGVDRVLTSGGAPTAMAGAPRLAGLVWRAAGRIAVLAGGGVRAEHAGALVAATGVREVHVRGTVPAGSAMRHRRPDVSFRKSPPVDAYERAVTSAAEVRRVVEAVR